MSCQTRYFSNKHVLKRKLNGALSHFAKVLGKKSNEEILGCGDPRYKHKYLDKSTKEGTI